MEVSGRLARQVLRLSHEQRDRIRRVYGQTGDRWLSELTGRLERCRERWSLELDSCRVTGSGIVATGRRLGHEPVVLKLIVDRSAFIAESAALGLFRLRGAVTVLDQSLEDAALLLQRIEPGVALHELVYSGSDDRATRIAGEVIARLQAEPVQTDPQLVDAIAEAFKALDGYLAEHQDRTGAIPLSAVRRAEGQLKELSAGGPAPVTLHGDLHHGNILRSGEDAWTVIDPKGKVGPPAYECTALVRNPIDYLLALDTPATVLNRRVDQLAEITGIDRQELAMWTDAMAVVAACWQLEDGEPRRENGLLISEALT